MVKKKLWKIFAGLQIALLVVMLAVTPASAAELRGNSDVIVASGDVVNDDLYMAGSRIIVNGTVNGDVLAAGSTIIIDGTVNGDVIALGSSITLSGTITGSARVAGSSIDITGSVGEDVVVAGSKITVREAASIGRDVVFGGGNVNIRSIVNGDLLGAAEIINFTNEIGGDAAVDVKDLTIASTAVINGNLIYTSNNEADIDNGAVIMGEITRKTPVGERWYDGWIFTPAMRAWTKFLSYLAVLVVGIIVILVAPKKSKKTVEKLSNKPLQSLGWGALVFFVAPIAIVISILTVIGIPLGLIGLLTYGLLIFLSQLVVGLFIGYWILTRLNMAESNGKLVLGLFIGFSLLTLVQLIPVVGWMVWGVTVLFGIGSITLLFGRKKKTSVPVEVVETTRQ